MFSAGFIIFHKEDEDFYPQFYVRLEEAKKLLELEYNRKRPPIPTGLAETINPLPIKSFIVINLLSKARLKMHQRPVGNFVIMIQIFGCINIVKRTAYQKDIVSLRFSFDVST